MEAKKEYIANTANDIIKNKLEKVKGQDLARNLNTNGFLTNKGKQYVIGGRGVYKLIDATHRSLVKEKRKPEADNVANAFIDASGEPAWRFKED